MQRKIPRTLEQCRIGDPVSATLQMIAKGLNWAGRILFFASLAIGVLLIMCPCAFWCFFDHDFEIDFLGLLSLAFGIVVSGALNFVVFYIQSVLVDGFASLVYNNHVSACVALYQGKLMNEWMLRTAPDKQEEEDAPDSPKEDPVERKTVTRTAGENEWVCSQCGSLNLRTRKDCWRCGTTAKEEESQA